VPQQDTAAGASKRRLLSPADNSLVRAVGRVPAGVHVKLLVAFVGTALLVVVVGVLGLRLLGQSNERVATLGTLQVRAFSYGKLRSDALHVRLLLAQNVGGTTTRSGGTRMLAQAGWPSTRRSRAPSHRFPRRPLPTISDSGRHPRTSATCGGSGQPAGS